MYHLAINRVQSGPFSENEVRQRAARGEFGPTDLCWCDGWPQWRRIAEVFPPAEPPPLLVPPPALPPATPVAVPPVVGPAGPATSGFAIASFICGIGVLVLFPFFFLLAPAAVILGHFAKAKIRQSAGKLAGSGLATAGLLFGYIVGGLLLAGVSVGVFFAVREVRHNTQETAVREHLAQFWTAADGQLRATGATEVTYEQIVGVGKALEDSALTPVAGEDYHGLVVKPGDEWLSITLGDGRTVNYYAGSPAAAKEPAATIETEEEVSTEDAEEPAGQDSEAEPTPPDATPDAPANGPETRMPLPAFR
jgi:hypothetical protein